MAKASPIWNRFNAGEVSPLFYARVDHAKFETGAETMLNYIPLLQGGVTRRPGTKYVAEVKTSANKTRLVAFQFSTTQAYIIEFGNLYARFYMNNGQILSGGSPYEIVTPYATADLFELKFAQSADVLYIAHPEYAPRKLSRTGHTSWTLSTIDFAWPPFLTENVTALTLTASAVTGAGITLTASASLFNANHVGAYWKLSELVAMKHSPWATANVVAAGTSLRYNGNVYYTAAGGTTGSRPPVHESGTESDGAVSWEYRHGGSGYVQITGYTSATQVTATVIKRLPDSTTGGTVMWSEGAWSIDNGYPGAVMFFEDRLWWAGTTANPQTLWASRVGSYEDHKGFSASGTVADDDAMALTLNANDVNVIRWLQEDEKGLLVGTVGGEWAIRPSNLNEALTPTNVSAKRSTAYGTANIAPLRVGKATLYVQRSGRKLRELAYLYETDGFQSPDMTPVSEHITLGGVTDITYQQEPQSIVWAVRTDGMLLGFTYDRQQEMLAWHRHQIGGYSDSGKTVHAKVESVAVIPSPDGTRDELWMIVQRYIDGATQRYVEYLTPMWDGSLDQEDAFFVDCGLTYDSTPATNITGLDHLKGETVTVLADGAAHATELVSAGGGVTLDRSTSVAQIGFGYNSDLGTLRVEAGAQDGTSQGKTKRIHRVALRFWQTLGVKVGPDASNLDLITFRTSSDAMGAAVPLYTGDKEVPWRAGYDTNGRVFIRQDQPFPGTILMIAPQVVTQDRG